MLYYWHIVLICLFFFFHLFYFVHKKISSSTANQLNQLFLFIFLGLILFNAVKAIPVALRYAAQDNKNLEQNGFVPSFNNLPANKELNMPNVYYFIFDEFAGYDSIKRYCNYDNQNFYEELEELGFVTSKHSRNKTFLTLIEIPNLLQLQEINDSEMSANDQRNNLKNPYLLNLMKQNGYQINGFNSTNYQFIDENLFDFKITKNFKSTYKTTNSYIIQNTAYYPFYGKNEQNGEIRNINNLFNYAKDSYKILGKNLFTIGYFQFPHNPYIVNEFGNKTNNSERNNLQDTELYLGQFKYTEKRILEMVAEIILNDPNSIIILQSDHGFRLPSYLSTFYNVPYDSTVENYYMCNILNAVYYRGEKINITDLSGLATLKKILNKLLDVY